MHHPTDRIAHTTAFRGALAGTRNSSMGPPHEGSIRRPMSERSYHGATSRSSGTEMDAHDSALGHLLVTCWCKENGIVRQATAG